MKDRIQEKGMLTQLIGMTKEDGGKFANENGYRVRTTKEDGKPYMITCDLRFDRINFTVENNLITNVEIG